MMGTAALTGLFVLHVSRRHQGVMRPTLVALHRRYFPLGNCHFLLLAMARRFAAIPGFSAAASRVPAPLAWNPNKPTPRLQLGIRGRLRPPYIHIPGGVPERVACGVIYSPPRTQPMASGS